MESFTKNQAHESFTDPEIKKILEQVNTDSLNALVAEFAVHCGIAIEKINFLEIANIKNTKSSAFTTGNYSLETKEINLNEKGLSLAFKIDTKSDKAARVLSVLIHEQVHAFGGTKDSVHDEDALLGFLQERWKTAQSGFLEISKPTSFSVKDPREKFRWFNEGMVDEFASQIYTEYLRREPMSPIDPEKNMDFREAYPLARLFVRSLRDTISEESGVPPEVVWQALIRLYVEGRSFLEEEVKGALEEVFTNDLVDRLAQINSSLTSPIETTAVFREVLNRERTRKIITSVVKTIAQELK